MLDWKILPYMNYWDPSSNKIAWYRKSMLACCLEAMWPKNHCRVSKAVVLIEHGQSLSFTTTYQTGKFLLCSSFKKWKTSPFVLECPVGALAQIRGCPLHLQRPPPYCCYLGNHFCSVDNIHSEKSGRNLNHALQMVREERNPPKTHHWVDVSRAKLVLLLALEDFL